MRSIIGSSSLIVVIATGIYFLTFAGTALLVPAQARRFLSGFAASPATHYSELFIRFIVGGSLVVHAPNMLAPGAISLFGWIILITTVCLLFLPWQWHHGFAQYVVPFATRYIAIMGFFSLILGVSLLMAVILGNAT